MGKRHIQDRPREPFQQCPGIGLQVHESEHVAPAALQYIGEVLGIGGDDVPRVRGQLPVLVGDGVYLHLKEERGRGEERGKKRKEERDGG